jgi:hypothetical protein
MMFDPIHDFQGEASITVRSNDWFITSDENGNRVSTVQVPLSRTMTFSVTKYDDGGYEAQLSDIQNVELVDESQRELTATEDYNPPPAPAPDIRDGIDW